MPSRWPRASKKPADPLRGEIEKRVVVSSYHHFIIPLHSLAEAVAGLSVSSTKCCIFTTSIDNELTY
jgi:hypothetical protein